MVLVVLAQCQEFRASLSNIAKYTHTHHLGRKIERERRGRKRREGKIPHSRTPIPPSQSHLSLGNLKHIIIIFA